MGKNVVLTVITYDISSDRARAKVAAALEQVAVRVQLSVFEARLTLTEVKRLSRQLKKRLAPGDSVRFYPVSAERRERLLVVGTGTPPEAGPFMIF